MKLTEGYKIRLLRLLHEYSQREVAEQVGITQTYLGMVEKGERNISYKHKENVANFFGVGILTLFDNEDPQLFIDYVANMLAEMNQKETQT